MNERELLRLESIFSGYGDIEVLHGISMYVTRDEVVTIIGPNGSGKSTLLKTIMGYLTPIKGNVFFRNENITNLKTHERVKKGIGYVPQLDNVFPSLTVQETLEMGGYILNSEEIKKRIKQVYRLFPVLEVKKNQKVATVSGGQRQMLAMGRALMTKPRILLLDEPSAGLSPKMSSTVFYEIQKIHQAGTAIVIVEQDAYRALEISDRGYVLTMGQCEYEDKADKILKNEKIKKAYLGG